MGRSSDTLIRSTSASLAYSASVGFSFLPSFTVKRALKLPHHPGQSQRYPTDPSGSHRHGTARCLTYLFPSEKCSNSVDPPRGILNTPASAPYIIKGNMDISTCPSLHRRFSWHLQYIPSIRRVHWQYGACVLFSSPWTTVSDITPEKVWMDLPLSHETREIQQHPMSARVVKRPSTWISLASLLGSPLPLDLRDRCTPIPSTGFPPPGLHLRQPRLIGPTVSYVPPTPRVVKAESQQFWARGWASIPWLN